MTTLIALGLGIFVAVALSIFVLCRERKAKSPELGPRAASADFKAQSEARR